MDVSKDKLEDLSDAEILQRIEDGEFIHRFEESADWRLFREACKRLAQKASDALDNVPADKTVAIIELQVMKKFCKHVVHGIINAYKQDGFTAFEQAKARKLVKRRS